MYENKQEEQTAVLAAIDTGEYDAQRSMEELEELAKSAGAKVMGRVIQKKDRPDPATLMGSGRVEELAEFVQNSQVELVIFDHELSPAQQKNLENALGAAVIDRTTLILDIFAQRAKTSEGRLQVELAQLKYRLPRLAGQGTSLSRLGGGIGTRGPGESKLESDRRHIRRRIHALEEELEALEKRRGLLRQRRKKDDVVTVAIVGYTNVGKSTLLNTLTDAGVLAKDMLFATLDPTSRALDLPDGRRVMLIDTVGLVSRLPHQLVQAFHSTLEEAADADLVLNVCDVSSPEFDQQLEVTTGLLKELGAENVPVLTVRQAAGAAADFGPQDSSHLCQNRHGTGKTAGEGCAESAADPPAPASVDSIRQKRADWGDSADRQGLHRGVPRGRDLSGCQRGAKALPSGAGVYPAE